MDLHHLNYGQKEKFRKHPAISLFVLQVLAGPTNSKELYMLHRWQYITLKNPDNRILSFARENPTEENKTEPESSSPALQGLHWKLVASGEIPRRLSSGRKIPPHCDKCLWLLPVIGNSWIHSRRFTAEGNPWKLLAAGQQQGENYQKLILVLPELSITERQWSAWRNLCLQTCDKSPLYVLPNKKRLSQRGQLYIGG